MKSLICLFLFFSPIALGSNFSKLKKEKVMVLEYTKMQAEKSLKCVKKAKNMKQFRKCRIEASKRKGLFEKKAKKMARK